MTRETTKKTTGNKVADNGRERFLEAAENYRRIEQKITPFVRSRRFERYSTAGEWSSGPARDAREVIAGRASASSLGPWRSHGMHHRLWTGAISNTMKRDRRENRSRVLI